MSKPLISLVMMVKNEARSVEATIASCARHVDRVVVLDTGSEDGTQDLAQKAAAGVPFELFEEPFVDYGTTRNRALDLCGTETVFTLMLSGDETLLGAVALRQFCEHMRDAAGPEHGAYHLSVQLGDFCEFQSPRLARAEAGWRYVGAVHEILLPPDRKLAHPVLTVPRAWVRHDRTDSPDQMRATWNRHLDLLRKAITQDRTHARSYFYLGQTFQNLGRYEDADRAYAQRIGLGGWPLEVYEATYRRGICNAALNNWRTAEHFLLRAHSLCPDRAEPLVALARHYYEQRDWGLTYLFASRAAQLPLPSEGLFVNPHAYRFEAHDLCAIAGYYVGELERGRRAALRCLEHYPDDPRLRKNLSFYPQPAVVTRGAPHCVPVVGTGRSGTSLVAGMLTAMGVDMGHRLVPADQNNKWGTGEDAVFMSYNLQLAREETECAAREMNAYLAGRANCGGLWGVKDPRLCETWDQIEWPCECSVIVTERQLEAAVRSAEKAYGGQWQGFMEQRQEAARAIAASTGALLLRFEDLLHDPLTCARQIRDHLPPAHRVAISDAVLEQAARTVQR